LKSQVPLSEGERFSVVVKLKTKNHSYPIPVECHVKGETRKARVKALAVSTANLTAASRSVTWLAPVAHPGTGTSAVKARPTTGAEVAVAGCRMLLRWYTSFP